MASVELAVSEGGLIVVSCVISNRDGVSFLPETCRNREWLDLFAPPPGALVAAPMKLAMMESADRDGEAVAHLASHCPRLCKLDVVGIGRASTADETRLGSNKSQMIAVALSHRLTDDGDGFGPTVASWRAVIGHIRFAGIIVGCRFSEASKPHSEGAFQGLGVCAGQLVLEGKDPLRPAGKGLRIVKLIEL